jgi:tetratricopeptide (TPR) repeat protein
VYYSQRRFTEAVRALQHAANLSPHPSEYDLYLAQVYLTINQPQEALAALDAATDSSAHEPADTRKEIETQVAERRAKAWAKLGDLRQAVGFQQEALTYEPSNPRLWSSLADLYAAQGQSKLEQAARERAQTLSSPKP